MSLRYLFIGTLFLILSGCLKPVTELYPEGKEQRPVKAYVVELGWHVGIAVEGRHLRERLPGHDRLPETEFLLVGWGDDRYYPAERAGVGLFLRAAFWPTGSVIHVVGIDGAVDDYFSGQEIVKVRLSERGMEAMATHIAGRFQTGEDGGLRYAADGLYPNSAFFEAKGFYYFPRTSNWWAARTLRESGFPITPIYAITSGNVIRQTRKSGTKIK